MRTLLRRLLTAGLALCFSLSVGAAARAASPSPTPAASPTPSPDKPPAAVKVGVYLLNITDFDPRTGMFSPDFYLDMRSTDVDPTKFELMNGAVLAKADMTDRPNIYQYRIRSRMMADMDFHRYPFDRHRLTISIEDQLLNTEEFNYVVEPGKSGIDSGVRVPGWDLDPAWKAEVEGHYYGIYDDTYSRYHFFVTISRQIQGVIIKTLLPAVLVTSVVLHLNLSNAIPPVGYLTFADRFMIINYLGLVGGIAVTALTVFLLDRKQQARADLASRFLVWVPVAWFLLHLLNTLGMFLG
jgi:hypothetical protein